MINSGLLIRNKYPNIIHLTCLAHTLNLIVGDFMKCASISKLMATIIAYVKTIKHSQLLTATLSNIRSASDMKAALQLPVKTRWGSVVQCIEAFLKNKENLQVLAVNQNVADILSRQMKIDLKVTKSFGFM